MPQQLIWHRFHLRSIEFIRPNKLPIPIVITEWRRGAVCGHTDRETKNGTNAKFHCNGYPGGERDFPPIIFSACANSGVVLTLLGFMDETIMHTHPRSYRKACMQDKKLTSFACFFVHVQNSYVHNSSGKCNDNENTGAKIWSDTASEKLLPWGPKAVNDAERAVPKT